MYVSFWKTLPIGFAVAALLVFGIGAACAVASEDGTGGGGPQSETSVPESTVTINSVKEGTVDSIDVEGGQMVLALAGGEMITVGVDQNTAVTINGSTGTLADLQPGDSVEVEVDQETNVVTAIIATSEDTNTGTLPQTQEGTVDSVDVDGGQMVLALAGGEMITVEVDQNTVVTINGSTGTLADLQPGDSVEVEVDQETNVVTAIIATSEDTNTGTLPQTQEGTVDSVDVDAGQMVLALADGEMITVEVDQNTVVTINGSTGTLADLQPGDSVEVEVDQETNVANLITVVGEPVTTTGEIAEVNLVSQTMTVVTPDGRTLLLHLLTLDGSTQIIVEGGQGSLLDLVSGAVVEVTYDPDTMVISNIYVRAG